MNDSKSVQFAQKFVEMFMKLMLVSPFGSLTRCWWLADQLHCLQPPPLPTKQPSSSYPCSHHHHHHYHHHHPHHHQCPPVPVHPCPKSQCYEGWHAMRTHGKEVTASLKFGGTGARGRAKDDALATNRIPYLYRKSALRWREWQKWTLASKILPSLGVEWVEGPEFRIHSELRTWFLKSRYKFTRYGFSARSFHATYLVYFPI